MRSRRRLKKEKKKSEENERMRYEEEEQEEEYMPRHSFMWSYVIYCINRLYTRGSALFLLDTNKKKWSWNVHLS